MAYLNHREGVGYGTKELIFHPQEGEEPFQTLVYIGTVVNPHYLGPAPIEDIAKQVVTSRGNSGCNTEYVLKLAQAMREIAPLIQDTHLFMLEKKIKEMVMKDLREVCISQRTKEITCTCDHCDHLIMQDSIKL